MKQFFFFFVLLSGLTSQLCAQGTLVYQHKQLEIEQISPHTYVHRSFLMTMGWGKVACNGLLYIQNGEAVIMDTPTQNEASELLISWILQNAKAEVKAVIVTHFHEDCLGGLAAFHQKGIPSYASLLTQTFAAKDTAKTVPLHGFDSVLRLTIGGQVVESRFVGEGHTRDNIVCHVPADEVLFGGCLVKTLQADKGFLGDANEAAWASTIEKVKSQYPNLRHVVPGHGASGGTELLDYTSKLFARP